MISRVFAHHTLPQLISVSLGLWNRASLTFSWFSATSLMVAGSLAFRISIVMISVADNRSNVR